MIRKPLIISFRLDEATRTKIRDRVGPNRRLKTLSQFLREGIELRLMQSDPNLGWTIHR